MDADDPHTNENLQNGEENSVHTAKDGTRWDKLKLQLGKGAIFVMAGGGILILVSSDEATMSLGEKLFLGGLVWLIVAAIFPSSPAKALKALKDKIAKKPSSEE